MPLSKLHNWQPTADHLHAAARILGFLRLLGIDKQPHYLEQGLRVTPLGVATDTLPGGGAVLLDFTHGTFVYEPGRGQGDVIPLAGKSQGALLMTLLELLDQPEFGGALASQPGVHIIDRAYAYARSRSYRPPVRSDLAGDQPLDIDTDTGRGYAEALWSIFNGVARFRARLLGQMTPVVVWPHHFDLSTLWFLGEPDEHKPHINLGFAPFSEGLPRPYLYAYAYPYPEPFDPPPLPAPARWHTEGWTGVVVDYDAIASQNDPAEFVEALCEGIFGALRPLLR